MLQIDPYLRCILSSPTVSSWIFSIHFFCEPKIFHGVAKAAAATQKLGRNFWRKILGGGQKFESIFLFMLISADVKMKSQIGFQTI